MTVATERDGFMGNGNGPDIEIIVIADPTGGGSGGTWFHPTIQEKELYENLADLLTVGSIVFGTGGAIVGLGGPELFGPALFAILEGAAMGVGAVGFHRLASDPPQPDYERPVRVDRLAIIPPGASGAEIPGALPLFETLNDLIPLEKGILNAYERAQGANLAGNLRWAIGHGHGAQLLLGCVTTRLLQLASRLERLRSEDLDTLNLASSDYASLQDHARAHSLLTEDATAVLLNGGLSTQDLSDFEEMITQHEMDTVPVGNFKDIITSVSDRIRTAGLSLGTA